jgi:hypothetical protein
MHLNSWNYMQYCETPKTSNAREAVFEIPSNTEILTVVMCTASRYYQFFDQYA